MSLNKQEISKRLSSDNLYHFTKSVETIKIILRSGFLYSLIYEKIPDKETFQGNFMVCFCDIKIDDTKTHRSLYGNNAIVLSKKWGIKKCLQPVTYIHDNSPSVSSKYIAMRNRWREIRQKNPNRKDVPQAIMEYLIFSKLLDDAKLKHEMIAIDIAADPNLEVDIEASEKEFTEFIDILEKTGQKVQFVKYIFSMFSRINDLHEELERRDALTRVYNDPDSGRILYDEREWRGMKWCDDISKRPAAMRDRKLPVSENLTFSDDDIVAILVEKPEFIDDILRFISDEKNLLITSAIGDRVRYIDDFREGNNISN